MKSERDSTKQSVFRIEDTVVSILLRKLKTSDLDEDYIGHIANRVLDIVHSAFTNAEIREQLHQAAGEFPELREVDHFEEAHVKEAADQVIRDIIESLLASKQIEDALLLAKHVNEGKIPEDIQKKIAAL